MKTSYYKARIKIAKAKQSRQKNLSLAGYHLQQLPPEICDLRNLATLNLSFNNLTSLPKNIDNLTNLKTLILSRNNFIKLPTNLSALTSLNNLDVSHNNIKSVPNTIGHLVRIPGATKNLQYSRPAAKKIRSPNVNGDIKIIQNKSSQVTQTSRNVGINSTRAFNAEEEGLRKIVSSTFSTSSQKLQAINRLEFLGIMDSDIQQMKISLHNAEPTKSQTVHNIKVELLDWEVLPPGFYDMPQYQQDLSTSGSNVRIKINDRERFRFIENLGPNQAYRGSHRFAPNPYHVFVFSNCVVSECPTEGNAIYVLKGVDNWKTLLSIPKLDLRQDYANRVQRIMHRGEWKDRLRKAVR